MFMLPVSSAPSEFRLTVLATLRFFSIRPSRLVPPFNSSWREHPFSFFTLLLRMRTVRLSASLAKRLLVEASFSLSVPGKVVKVFLTTLLSSDPPLKGLRLFFSGDFRTTPNLTFFFPPSSLTLLNRLLTPPPHVSWLLEACLPSFQVQRRSVLSIIFFFRNQRSVDRATCQPPANMEHRLLPLSVFIRTWWYPRDLLFFCDSVYSCRAVVRST